MSISVVIPTYRREQVLVDTIACLLAQSCPPDEIVVVDQTEQHSLQVAEALQNWDKSGHIRLVRGDRPSIPRAMNTGLRAAKFDVVLFLDDDIKPHQDLVAEHNKAHRDNDAVGVVGQILQPGEDPVDIVEYEAGRGLLEDLEFPFRGTRAWRITNCMAGNLSVKRAAALAAGGFDENFTGDAYRFETEFCKRMVAKYGPFLFWPAASLRHLRAASGGTRHVGRHLTSADPHHTAGDYYYALLRARGAERWSYILYRFYRSVRTRFHLTHPWWIPVKLLGEWRGFCRALRLYRTGPAHVPPAASGN